MIYRVIYNPNVNIGTTWYILWDTEKCEATVYYPTHPYKKTIHNYPIDTVKQCIEQGYWVIEGDPFDLWVAEVREEAGL
jgi:hypothetical protein